MMRRASSPDGSGPEPRHVIGDLVFEIAVADPLGPLSDPAHLAQSLRTELLGAIEAACDAVSAEAAEPVRAGTISIDLGSHPSPPDWPLLARDLAERLRRELLPYAREVPSPDSGNPAPGEPRLAPSAGQRPASKARENSAGGPPARAADRGTELPLTRESIRKPPVCCGRRQRRLSRPGWITPS